MSPDDRVLFARLPDGTGGLFHLGTRDYAALNATGARVWELLVAGHSAPEAAARLAEEYGADRADCATFVRGFLEELVEAGLLARPVD